jgi:hypothetical protein
MHGGSVWPGLPLTLNQDPNRGSAAILIQIIVNSNENDYHLH